MRSTRTLFLVLFSSSPFLLAAKGCHFGADDVSLGTNRADDPSAGGGFGGEDVDAGGSAAVDAGGAGNVSSGGTGSTAPGTGGTDPGLAGNDFGGTGSSSAAAGGRAAGGSGGALTAGSTSEGGESAIGGVGGRSYGGDSGLGGMGAYAGGPRMPYWVCGLPRVPSGDCENPTPRENYGFNPETMECESFLADCEPGSLVNQFASQAECDDACTKYAPVGILGDLVPMSSDGEPAACIVPPHAPGCDQTEAFYFDPRTRECFRQACLAGTTNNFRTYEECVDACVPTPEEQVADADQIAGAAAVVQAASCAGFGDQDTDSTSGAEFTLEGTVLRLHTWYGCGCPTRAQYVLAYEPTSPLRLRLCDDFFASICQQACEATLEFDLKPAFELAGTTEFVFVD